MDQNKLLNTLNNNNGINNYFNFNKNINESPLPGLVLGTCKGREQFGNSYQ